MKGDFFQKVPFPGFGAEPQLFSFPGSGAEHRLFLLWVSGQSPDSFSSGCRGKAPTLLPPGSGAEPRLLFLLRYRRPDAVDCRGGDKIDAEFREEIDTGAQNHNEIYNTDARTDIQNIFLKR